MANDVGYTAVAANTLAFFSQLDFVEKATLVRVHGIVTVVPDTVSAAREIWGAVGMIVVKTAAASIGVTALPDPLADPQEDWYAFSFFSSATATAITDGVAWEHVQMLESKAMRKVGPDESSVIMVANGGAAASAINVMTRELVKLA